MSFRIIINKKSRYIAAFLNWRGYQYLQQDQQLSDCLTQTPIDDMVAADGNTDINTIKKIFSAIIMPSCFIGSILERLKTG
ncbi:hypothetical protein [Methylovulum psychrotolerans]|uniref:hypothetical protein n=1 Tax=Methylovulum psychrotolerans TaxID=1704499 RepID=UPI000CDEAF4A|nr:hypothetical protein [Methylovulum psychrotolerans]